MTQQTQDSSSWITLFIIIQLAALGFAAFQFPTQRRAALLWLREDKRRAALIVAVALAVIALVSMFLSFLLPYLMLAALVIYLVADWLRRKGIIGPPPPIDDQAVYNTICDGVYNTEKSCGPSVGLNIPFVVADVSFSPGWLLRNGRKVYQCLGVKTVPGLWTPQDLRHHELLLQTRFNSLNYQNGMPPLAVHLLDHQGHIVIQVESPFASAPPAPPPPANAAPPPSGPFADFDFLDDDDDE